MTLPHENLFAQSVWNRTRGSTRGQVGNTLSGPGVPPTPITTQSDLSFGGETFPSEPTGEPASGTTVESNTLRDEHGANPNDSGQFNNELIKSLKEVIEDYRNKNIESFQSFKPLSISPSSSSTTWWPWEKRRSKLLMSMLPQLVQSDSSRMRQQNKGIMPHMGHSPKRPTLEATMPQEAIWAHTDTAGNNAADHEHPPTLLAWIVMGENLEGTMRGHQIERNVSMNQRCFGTRGRSLWEVAVIMGTKQKCADPLTSSASVWRSGSSNRKKTEVEPDCTVVQSFLWLQLP